MFAAVTSPTALSTAYSRFSHTTSRYLYFKKYFSLENTSSIGFRSAEYTGRKTSSMSRSFRKLGSALSPSPWCAARLSTTTMSPTSRIGRCVIGSTVREASSKNYKNRTEFDAPSMMFPYYTPSNPTRKFNVRLAVDKYLCTSMQSSLTDEVSMTSIRQLKSWLIKKLNRGRIFVFQIVNVQLSAHYIFRSKTLWCTFRQSFSGIVAAT